MQKVVFNSLIDLPWKNGQGSTRALMIYPEDADISNFMWRISIASIRQLGDFSNFPNITRSLAVLSGNGLTLSISKSLGHVMAPLSTILEFSGDDECTVIACPEPILDFGVMSQNDQVKHTLNLIYFENLERYQRHASMTLICSTHPLPIYIKFNNEIVELCQYDSLFFNETDAQFFTVENQSDGIRADDTYPLLIVELDCETAAN